MTNQLKKEWQQPSLEVLDVNLTMGGPNGRVADMSGKGANNRNLDS